MTKYNGYKFFSGRPNKVQFNSWPMDKSEIMQLIFVLETNNREDIKFMQMIDLSPLKLTEVGNFVYVNEIVSYYELEEIKE